LGEAKNIKPAAISIIMIPTSLLTLTSLMTTMAMSPISILTKAVATSISTKMTNQVLTRFVSRDGIPIAIESKVFANI